MSVEPPREAASRRADGASPREALLSDVLTALTSTGDLREMLQRCAQAVVERFDAAFARIWTLDDATGVLELAASAGMYTHLDGGHSRVPVGRFKIGRIAQHRRPHLNNDVLGDDEISDPEWARREAMVAFAGYPLLVGDRLVGVVALFARHELSREALDAFSVVADSLALGIQRRRSEEQLLDENRILDKLYELGTAMSSELDLQRVVQITTDAATELTGAQFGAFFYNEVSEQGESYMLYTLSGVPYEAFADFPLPRNTALFAPTFVGEAVVRIDDVLADDRYGKEPPYHGMPAGHLPVRSYLAVPVVTQDGVVIGGLFFGHSEVGIFTERAERIVVGIAGHAAGAVHNARSYEREHRAAVALQHSLLPDRLPEVDDVSLAARYVPGSRRADVGGDWYDAIVLADGRIAISVGDVVGHDLHAAAVMGQLRTVARAYALDALGPADVVARVDRFVREVGLDGFATTVQLWYDPATGVADAVTAGHPPPLLLSSDGTAGFMSLEPLPPAGCGLIEDAAAQADRTRTVLAPGSTLILYSDGLVERRGESLEVGLERLRTAAIRALGLPAEELCDYLLKELIDVPADDIVLLVIKLPAAGPLRAASCVTGTGDRPQL